MLSVQAPWRMQRLPKVPRLKGSINCFLVLYIIFHKQFDDIKNNMSYYTFRTFYVPISGVFATHFTDRPINLLKAKRITIGWKTSRKTAHIKPISIGLGL